MIYNDKKNPIKNKKGAKFSNDAYRYAIAMIESSGGKFLDTKTSSAAGKYHFLYNLIKNDPSMRGVSKREFINRPELQEHIMDKALSGKLKGYTYGEKYANKLKGEFNSDYDVNSLTAMVHFLGSGNARKFLKDPVNFRVPGAVNLTGDQYISKFVKHFNDYQEKNPNSDKSLIDGNSLPEVPEGLRYQQPLSSPKVPKGLSSKGRVRSERPYNTREIDKTSVDRGLLKKMASQSERGIQKFEQRQEELNNFKRGGQMNCGGPGQPPCDEKYFEIIRNSRQGLVNENSDGTESTHRMTHQSNPNGDGSFVSFPTLFLNEDKSWKDLNPEEYIEENNYKGKRGWRQSYNRALKDNEIYTFKTEEEAKKFAVDGSWKNNKFKQGGQMTGMSGAQQLVTMFENGGSHEQNPLGGIPQGVGANGKTNLVEEGETKWNDYIFSNSYDMNGNFTGKDGKKSNVFEKGGNLNLLDTEPPVKRKKIKNEKIAALKVRDNIIQQNKFQIKPHSQKLIDSINRQEQVEKTGEIKQYEPQSAFSRIKEVALNPVTAFGYAARNQVLPENFSRGERNPVDYAVDVINPAQYVEDAKNVVEGAYKGDLSQVGQGALGVLPLGLEAKNLYRGVKGGARKLAEFVPKKLSKNKLDSSTPKINKTITPENISVKDINVDKMKEATSNTPAFYKDGVKLIDELELSKMTDDYLENTLSAESMAMRKKLDKEWGSTFYRDALEYERQYDNYRGIGGNKSVKLMPDERYEKVLEKMKKRGFKDFQGLSSSDRRNVIFEEGFPGYISRNEITRNGAERGKEFIKTVMDHEVAHGLNFNGKSIGPKLSKEIKGFFKDDIMDLANEKSTIDGLSSLESQRAYIQNPTETISFLVTNLKTELKNLKIIPDYNSKIKYSDLKNSKTWKRFSKYVKTEKVNELLDFINKMPRSVVPGAIGTAAASQYQSVDKKTY